MSDGSRLDAPRAAAITVRPGHPGDRRFVLEATRRLAAFGTPPGRTSEEIVEGEARTLRAFFDTASPPETLLIAEIEEDPCGFVFLAASFKLDRINPYLESQRRLNDNKSRSAYVGIILLDAHLGF